MSNIESWADYPSDEEGDREESHHSHHNGGQNHPSNGPSNHEQRSRGDREYVPRGGRDGRGRGRGHGSSDRNYLPPIPKDGPTPFVVYVTNLSYSATIDDVGNYFADGGCNVADVSINEGGTKGVALVYFSDSTSLKRSHEADGTLLLGRTIRIKSPETRRQERTERTEHVLGRRMGGDRSSVGERGAERGGDRDRDRYSTTTRANGPHSRESDIHSSNQRNYPRDGGRERPTKPKEGPITPADSADVWTRRHVPEKQVSDSVEVKTSTEGTMKKEKPEDDIMATKPPSVERPVLNLKPRTVPIEEIGKPVAPAAIFGEGKPRDVFVHEKKVTSTSEVKEIADIKRSDTKLSESSSSSSSSVLNEIPSSPPESPEKGKESDKSKYNQEKPVYRASHRTVINEDTLSKKDSNSGSQSKPKDKFEETTRKDGGKKFTNDEGSNKMGGQGNYRESNRHDGRGNNRGSGGRDGRSRNEGSGRNSGRYHESSDRPNSSRGGGGGGDRKVRGPPKENSNSNDVTTSQNDGTKVMETKQKDTSKTEVKTVADASMRSRNAFDMLQDGSDDEN